MVNGGIRLGMGSNKNNSTKNSYLNNELTLLLFKLSNKNRIDISKRDGYDNKKNNHHLLTEQEKYVINTMDQTFKIQGLIEQLYFIKVFIRRFPFYTFYKENEINQLNYIQYHTEVLLHKIHTITEIMKLILNQVYLLKLTPKNCT